MKKRPLLFILLFPLLMANSPSPELYPDEYFDYELINESVTISEEGEDRYVTFAGELVNNGEGIISFRASELTYRFEGDDYEIIVDDYNIDEPIQGILPGTSYVYQEKHEYYGTAPLGEIAYISKRITIRGYVEDDIIDDVVISNLSVTDVDYDEGEDTTTYTISFDWDNPGEYSVETMYIAVTKNDEQYVHYEWESLDKKSFGQSQVYISFPGDVSDQELSNIELFFIRRAYERNGWGWNFFNSPIFYILLIIISITAVIIVVGPIAIITIVLIITKRKKHAKKT
ncbi:MAG: hypothetical protein PHU55_00125 [Bacilli bacterium]|nr:hypothetical protein [Bacilli bacterium]